MGFSLASPHLCPLTLVLLPLQESLTGAMHTSGPSLQPPHPHFSCISLWPGINIPACASVPLKTFLVLGEDTCSQGTLWSLLQSPLVLMTPLQGQKQTRCHNLRCS